MCARESHNIPLILTNFGSFVPYVRKFSWLINVVVFVVRKDPRNYSSANINEKMAADGIMYRFGL